jgi:hypothetical protein
MWKHNNTQEQKRREWNAASGPMSSQTVTTRPAQAAMVGNRAKGSYYVRTDVQTLIEGATNPNQTAGMLDAGRQSGVLGRDEQSQDQASYYAVQMQIEDLANNKLDAGATAANAWADAESETLADYDASGAGKDVVARYRKVQAIAERDYGPQVTTSSTTRTGRDALPAYPRTASTLGIDPYDERHTIAQLDQEIVAKESELQPDIDLIGRTREVTSEKFGPGLVAGLLGGPHQLTAAEQNRGRRDPRVVAPQRARAARALESYFAGGGTVEELQRMGIMPMPREERATRREQPAERIPPVLTGDPEEEVVPAIVTPDTLLERGYDAVWNDPSEQEISFRLNDGTYMYYRTVPPVDEVAGGYNVGEVSKPDGPGTWTINEVSEDGQTITKATYTYGTPPTSKVRTDRSTLDDVQEHFGAPPEGTAAQEGKVVGYHLSPDGRIVEFHRDDAEGAEWTMIDERVSEGAPEYTVAHGKEYVPEQQQAPEETVTVPAPQPEESAEDPAYKPVIPMDIDLSDPTGPSPSRLRELEEERAKLSTQAREPILDPPWRGKEPIDMQGFDIGDPTAPTPKEPEATEETEEEDESDIKRMLREMQEATDVPSDVLGINAVPTLQEHRGNLLAGFTGAATLLEKPAALDRKTANAAAGSPQEYARAVIDAEQDKPADQRSTLEEIVGNVAQQYNAMGDMKGREQALEYTIALYKLFLDSNTLTDRAGGGTGRA